MPRVRAGLSLAGVASAAIDVSDGLIADLGHICRGSGCGARIDVDRIPMAAGLTDWFSAEESRGLALHGGDDYELCFTASPAAAAAVERIMSECELSIHRIGRMVAGHGIRDASDDAALDVDAGGYSHF